MADIKYPIVYVLNLKRGVKWTERRIELNRDKIKYFNPSNLEKFNYIEDNELRFESKLADCLLVVDGKKLKLMSKSGSFKDVKFKHEKPEILKKFKEDFDKIKNYKDAISDIKSKNFVIENEQSVVESNLNGEQHSDYNSALGEGDIRFKHTGDKNLSPKNEK
jgi:hypothetical protein